MTRPTVLALAALLGFAAAPSDARRPQPTPEAAFGRGPVPPVVRMTGERIVALTVRPTVLLTRGDVRVEARVPRHASNRLLAISWTSDVGSVGATQRGLEGADALVLHVLRLPSQPAANYLFVATVFNQVGKVRGRAEARIRTPEGGER